MPAPTPTDADRQRWAKQMEHWTRRVNFNRSCGMTVSQWDRDGVVMHLPHSENLCNSTNGIHGGVVSALADTCGTGASLAAIDFEGFIATVSLNVNYLAPALTDLKATARCVKPGRRIQLSRVDVHDVNGRLVAEATVTNMIP